MRRPGRAVTIASVTVPQASAPMPRHLVRAADLGPAGLERLLDCAARMGRTRSSWPVQFRGQALACFLARPSAGVRASVEVAAARLGLLPLVLDPAELRGRRGGETARTLSGYVAAIFVRTRSDDVVARLARDSLVPVVNAGSASDDPCQALADLLTLKRRFGDLRGLRIAYVGEPDDAGNSLIEAAALAGIEVRIAPLAPASDPRPRSRRPTTAGAAARPEALADPRDAARGADALCLPLRRRRGVRAPGEAVRDLLACAAPGAAVLGSVASAGDGDCEGRSLGRERWANRLPAQQAILCELIAASGGPPA